MNNTYNNKKSFSLNFFIQKCNQQADRTVDTKEHLGVIMMANYSAEEEKELNNDLKMLQNRANRLIMNDYYDHVKLSDIQYSALTAITNANSHKDISWYLWNSGILDKTLDYIAEKIKVARRNDITKPLFLDRST